MTSTIDRMSARARAADACDYSGTLPLIIEAAPAARRPGSGQKVSTTMEPSTTPTMASPAPAKPETSTPEAKTPKARNERTAAIAAARAKGKRGKGKEISRQHLLDYIHEARMANPGSSKSTESSYAWWVLKYAFSSPLWNELWALAEKGVTQMPVTTDEKFGTHEAAKDLSPKTADGRSASGTAMAAVEAAEKKAAPAKATGAAKKTPGQKRRESSKAEPKARTRALPPSAADRAEKAAVKRTRKATAKPSGEKQVTTNFKAEK